MNDAFRTTAQDRGAAGFVRCNGHFDQGHFLESVALPEIDGI